MEALNAIHVIIGLAIVIVGYFIATPIKTEFMSRISTLSANIQTLVKAVERINDKLDLIMADLSDLRERLAKAEASTSSAHKRLDEFEKRLVAVEHKCETCGKK